MTFNDERSAAIRDGLVATVNQKQGSPARRRLAGAALLASGLLVGAAVSAAALTIGAPPVMISGTQVEAPPGVLPGEPIISLLGGTTTTTVEGTKTLDLPDVPAGATHVRVSLSCLDAGMVSWGFDPAGNNPSSGCDGPDADGRAGWMDFDLDESDGSFYITARDGVGAIVTFQFVNYVETDWGVNANGETFGVSQDGRPNPDLLAAWITDAHGEQAIGYLRAADLEAFSPDHPRQPSNPEEATAWQTERDEKYPNGWDVPAYDSDGTTQIGAFHLGG